MQQQHIRLGGGPALLCGPRAPLRAGRALLRCRSGPRVHRPRAGGRAGGLRLPAMCRARAGAPSATGPKALREPAGGVSGSGAGSRCRTWCT